MYVFKIRKEMHVSRFLLGIFLLLSAHLKGFDKVVIWGHKLHSHTHSYVHNAFFRAFKELGYSTYWFDDADNVQNEDFSGALFITEGQVDKNIPLRSDCRYILHNCSSSKYAPLYEAKKAISLQVYTDDVLSNPNCKKVAPCIYYDLGSKSIYMPWATDLLPKEIDLVKKKVPITKKNRNICWVGTIGAGVFGNIEQITPFKNMAKNHGIGFQSTLNISLAKHEKLIRSAYMAPTIVGKWQQEKGYIPCRIFKNISYGQMGITNSPRIYELFEGKIIYNSDSAQLFLDAHRKMQNMNLQELYDLMDFVKFNHTYINRIETLLDFFKKIEND